MRLKFEIKECKENTPYSLKNIELLEFIPNYSYIFIAILSIYLCQKLPSIKIVLCAEES